MYKKSSQGWLKHFDFIAIDIVCAELSFFLAALCREHGKFPYYNESYRTAAIWLFLIDALVCVCFSSYARVLKRDYVKELQSALFHTVEVSAFTIVILYMTKETGMLPRLAFVGFIFIYFVLGYVVRCLWKNFIMNRLKEKAVRSFIIATSSDMAEQVVNTIKTNNRYGLKLTGLILLDKEKSAAAYGDVPVVANAETAEEYLCHEWVDEVFFNIPEQIELPSKLLEVCEMMGITVHVRMAKMEDMNNSGQFVQKIAGYLVITSSANVMTSTQALMKRLMDIAGGIVGSLMTLVFTIIIGPIIYVKSPGPIFFSQVRIGMNGRRFKIYKFRSMYMDAEERKKELMEKNKVKDGMMFKMDDDPRIIKGIGHFIRKTSIDEFPQFFNILKGDMSMVGTRPPTVDEWEKYSPHHRIRMATKPGLTGMWQVSGRSDITDFEEVVRLDEQYIRNWSFGLDIRIILKTIVNVIKGSGAE